MRLQYGALVLVFVVGCGGGGAAAPTAEPAAAPASSPAAAKPSVSAVAAPSPTAVPKPTATTAAPASTSSATTVYVGNTDGIGVYVRNTPVMSDRLRAYPDGTALTIIGDDVDGDGQHWRHVKTPDGLEGYVPAMYIVDTPS